MQQVSEVLWKTIYCTSASRLKEHGEVTATLRLAFQSLDKGAALCGPVHPGNLSMQHVLLAQNPYINHESLEESNVQSEECFPRVVGG